MTSPANVGQADRPGLVRAVSRWQLVGLSINDVIGSGVYLLPAAAAALLGNASILGVIVAGLAVALLVLCFAEASSYFDEPGGGYLYTREAFGSFIGFEVGWMTWLARIASVASLSTGLTRALAYVWPAAETNALARAAVITTTIALLAWVNVVGVKEGARTAVFLVVTKTLPLVLFILIGVWFVDWSRAFASGPAVTGDLGEAALLLLFAYAGFENAPAAAGEYKNPQRDVPFALLTMIAIITAIYTAVQLVAQGTLPGLGEAESPLAEAAAQFMGSGFALVMTVGAIISIFGNIANTTLIGPRYAFALAQDGFGPRAMASVHPRYRTPWIAVIAQSTIALVLALTGSFVQLAMLSIIARLATYIGTAASVPFLRRKYGARSTGFRLPGGPLIPILALLVSLIFLSSAEARNLIAGAIALLIGAIVYALRRRTPTRVVDA